MAFAEPHGKTLVEFKQLRLPCKPDLKIMLNKSRMGDRERKQSIQVILATVAKGI